MSSNTLDLAAGSKVKKASIRLESIEYSGSNVGSDWQFSIKIGNSALELSPKGIKSGSEGGKVGQDFPSIILEEGKAKQVPVTIQAVEIDPKHHDVGAGSGIISIVASGNSVIPVTVAAEGGDQGRVATLNFNFSVNVKNIDEDSKGIDLQGDEDKGVVNRGGKGGATVTTNEPTVTITNTEEQRFRSVTRDDCQFQRIGRHIQPIIKLDASGLRLVDTKSRRLTEQSITKEELKEVISRRLSVQAKLDLGIQLGNIGNASAGASAESSSEKTAESVYTVITSSQYIVYLYEMTFAGPVKVRQDLDVTETWAWVGSDCPRKPSENIRYLEKGPELSYDTNTTVVVLEVVAEASEREGRKWAQNRGAAIINDLIRSLRWLPADPLPLPLGFGPLSLPSSSK